MSSDNALFGRAGQFESPFDSDALYIPAANGDPLVVYASGFDLINFSNYVGAPQEGYIEQPYARRASWNTLLDLRIQQQLPLFGDRASARLYMNIDNFLNLLNSDWGVFKNGPGFSSNGQNNIVSADIVRASDVSTLGVDAAPALEGDAPRTACIAPGSCLYRYNSFSDRDINVIDAERSVYTIRLGIRIDF